MAIFAISDLHLSLNRPKPMDVFGEAWLHHDVRIAANWDSAVGNDDTVLVAGDHSWALRFEEAKPDLDYIAARPGRKILIRGNHDYWWARESTNRIQRQLHKSIQLMHGRGIVVENVGITGTRGWRVDDQTQEEGSPGDLKVMRRELMYLERGLREIPKLVDRKLVMLHYPPFDADLEPNDFARLLQAYEVDILVYGHIHTGQYLEGRIDGIEYRLVSVDHTGFAPVKVV
jgi:predicted phosphohydrolase